MQEKLENVAVAEETKRQYILSNFAETIDRVYWNRIGGSTLAHTNTANSSICLPHNDAIIPSSCTYLKLWGQKYFEIVL